MIKRPIYTKEEGDLIKRYYHKCTASELLKILADAGYNRTAGSLYLFAFRNCLGRQRVEETKYERSERRKYKKEKTEIPIYL